MRRRISLAFALAVAAVCAGCSSPEYTVSPELNYTYEDVWAAARKAVEKEFGIASEDKKLGELVSEWAAFQMVAFDSNLQRRARVTIEKTTSYSCKAKVLVETRTQTVFDNISETMKAPWKDGDPDLEYADVMMMKIRVSLELGTMKK